MALYVIMLGVQGAGKGVQAQFISGRYGIPQVSTGDLFRAMRTRSDELARRVQDIMNAGNLVDDDTTNAVVADRLAQDDARNGVILDGFPRNQFQADFLEEYLRQKGQSVSGVLLLELDLYTAFRRAFGRVSSANGASYNIYSQNQDLDIQFVEHPEKAFPPRIDATLRSTGEKLIRRPDDANAAAIIKRIDTYLETTQPLIDYYRAKGLLRTIDADRPIEIVSEEIAALIDAAGK